MKRPYSSVVEETAKSKGDSSSDGKAKRAKPATAPATAASTDALALLQRHAKELRDCLKAVKKEGAASSDAIIEQLSELSRTLLPAFQTLGDHTAGEADQSNEPTSLSTPPPPPPPVTAASLLRPSPSTFAAPTRPQTRFSNRIPPLGTLTAWTPEDILRDDAYPPPLPQLTDTALERMALTHHGMRTSDWDPSYENLEFLGDAFIYYLASELLSQTFADLGPGRLSQLRERLLRNSNLATYTRQYGLVQRARIPPEFIGGAQVETNGRPASQKEYEKVLADLFEAHVGALIRLDEREGEKGSPMVSGVDRATRWLRSLWAGTLAREIREEYRKRTELAETGRLILPKGGAAATATASSSTSTSAADSTAATVAVAPNRILPKVELSRRIGCRGVVIRYEDVHGKQRLDRISNLPLFTVSVWVDAWGTTACLGHGSGLSKKDAGSKAAETALGNKKQMQFYEDKKKAFVAAQEAQAAAGM